MMQISRDFSGFTMSEADTLRKGIGKKKKEILDELHPKFVQGAIKTSGVTEQEAEDVWAIIEKAGRYSWNLSHAVCYTLIS
jgi:DNA polymerase-3 subunit alpha